MDKLQDVLYLQYDRLFHARLKDHKLVITGEDPCPIEISNGGDSVETRSDLKTTHKEADIIIVQQLVRCASDARTVTVIYDDTDMFVLLLYHYKRADLDIPVYMESPSKGRTVIDIKSAVKKHSKIVADLLPAHSLSGCHTVVCCYGIGKGTVVKKLQARYDLSAIENIDTPLEDVLKQSTAFISACYGLLRQVNQCLIQGCMFGLRKMEKVFFLCQKSALCHLQHKHLMKMQKGHTSRQYFGGI